MYDFEIIYREGRKVEHAGYFSRNFQSNINDTSSKKSESVDFVEWHQGWLAVEQKRYAEIQELIEKHNSNGFGHNSKCVRKFIDSCIICNASKGPSGSQPIQLHPIPKIPVPW